MRDPKSQKPRLSVSLERAEELTFGTEDVGFCQACGHEQDGCEGDARGYTCDRCKKPEVYGFAELLVMGKMEVL